MNAEWAKAGSVEGVVRGLVGRLLGAADAAPRELLNTVIEGWRVCIWRECLCFAGDLHLGTTDPEQAARMLLSRCQSLLQRSEASSLDIQLGSQLVRITHEGAHAAPGKAVSV